MYSQQLKNINILLILILFIMIINLVIDLMPYMITAKILGSIFRTNSSSNEESPAFGFYKITPEPGEGTFFTVP